MLEQSAVTIKLVENFITVIGEVNSPGRYDMVKDVLTIYDAIALAGGATQYTNRKEIQIIRLEKDGTQIIVLDLTDKNLINAKGFYVYPNDLIYLPPSPAKMFAIGESIQWPIYLSLAGFIVLILNLNKYSLSPETLVVVGKAYTFLYDFAFVIHFEAVGSHSPTRFLI